MGLGLARGVCSLEWVGTGACMGEREFVWGFADDENREDVWGIVRIVNPLWDGDGCYRVFILIRGHSHSSLL